MPGLGRNGSAVSCFTHHAHRWGSAATDWIVFSRRERTFALINENSQNRRVSGLREASQLLNTSGAARANAYAAGAQSIHDVVLA